MDDILMTIVNLILGIFVLVLIVTSIMLPINVWRIKKSLEKILEEMKKSR